MLLIFPLFLYIIGIEEKMLIEKFGHEYTQYMERTKRLIPFIYGMCTWGTFPKYKKQFEKRNQVHLLRTRMRLMKH